jgi:ornithine carbamoyltransferase
MPQGFVETQTDGTLHLLVNFTKRQLMLATAPIANGLVNLTKPQLMLATLQSIAKLKSHHPGQRFSYQWASLNCLDTSQVTMFGT